MSKHKNDIYGDIKGDRQKEDSSPAIPAATVLLLKQQNAGLEILMLHKNSRVAFGGMWVFPGGKIDAGDYENSTDDNLAAINAAARETEEEAGIVIPKEDFVWFSHWTPPPSTAKRFATWFYVTSTDEDHDIQIDGFEIQNHQWISPHAALDQHAAGEIDLAPPTWVSLYHLSKFRSVHQAISTLSDLKPRYYQTHVVQDKDGNRVALWEGDAGYDDWNADLSGPTHRLTMRKGGFEFEHSAIVY